MDSAKKEQYLVSHQKRSHGSWRKCVRCVTLAVHMQTCSQFFFVRAMGVWGQWNSFQTPWIMQNLRFILWLSSVKFYEKKNLPHTTASDFPIPPPGNQLPISNTSGCQCNKRDGWYHLFEESQKKKCNGEWCRTSTVWLLAYWLLHTLDLLFTASNTLSVNGLATWQEQNVEVDCGH